MRNCRLLGKIMKNSKLLYIFYEMCYNGHNQTKEERNMSFSQKVNRLLKENGMTKAALAKESGIPYTTLDSMLKRETDTNRLAAMIRLARALGTSVEALVMEEENREQVTAEEKHILDLYSLLDSRGKSTVLSLLESQADYSNREKKEPLSHFPVYEAPAAAGSALPVLTEAVEQIPVVDGEIPRGASFGIRISGDSMEPLLGDGDIAYVQPCKNLSSGQIGIFLLNGESLCKKMVQKEGDVFLCSLNPAYSPIRILDSDDLKLVGRVISD